jgi:hypothetical protein
MISSTILMKFIGAFFKPNGMNNHLKKPSFDLKEVFHTYVYCSGVGPKVMHLTAKGKS